MIGLGNWLPALWAAAIGAGGSLAYFTALLFGFVQSEAILEKIWPSSRSVSLPGRLLRVFWFTLIGAAVALIFQLPQEKLAPIQAFIVGTTWPTIVSQTLTGRQGESPQTIRQQIAGLLGGQS